MKDITQKDSNYKVGRILVVDDEAELMSVLCEMLAGRGYEAAGFLSVAAALEDLTTRRSFRDAFSLSEALEEVSTHSGSQYDPASRLPA